MATSTTKRTAPPRKTTASKTSASNPTGSKPATAKPAPEKLTASPGKTAGPATSPATGAGAPEPKLVSVTDTVVSEPDLKKRELIDLVVERSGIKKKDAKPVIEAMLAVLGETIAAGRELNLQPLGKLRINRASEKGNGRVIVCKLRQSLARQTGPGAGPSSDPDKPPLAEAAE